MRARRDHRDRAVLPLSLSRREFLPGTHLPLGAAGIPGVEVFLHLVSLYDALHRLFDPSLWDLHLHLEDPSAAKSGKAAGVSNHVAIATIYSSYSARSTTHERRSPRKHPTGSRFQNVVYSPGSPSSAQLAVERPVRPFILMRSKSSPTRRRTPKNGSADWSWR